MFLQLITRNYSNRLENKKRFIFSMILEMSRNRLQKPLVSLFQYFKIGFDPRRLITSIRSLLNLICFLPHFAAPSTVADSWRARLDGDSV